MYSSIRIPSTPHVAPDRRIVQIRTPQVQDRFSVRFWIFFVVFTLWDYIDENNISRAIRCIPDPTTGQSDSIGEYDRNHLQKGGAVTQSQSKGDCTSARLPRGVRDEIWSSKVHPQEQNTVCEKTCEKPMATLDWKYKENIQVYEYLPHRTSHQIDGLCKSEPHKYRVDSS